MTGAHKDAIDRARFNAQRTKHKQLGGRLDGTTAVGPWLREYAKRSRVQGADTLPVFAEPTTGSDRR